MVLPSIGILKAKRTRGWKKKKKLIFYSSKKYLKIFIFFSIYFLKIILGLYGITASKSNHFGLVFSIFHSLSPSFLAFSLWKNSLNFFSNNTTHFDLQPIFKSRKFSQLLPCSLLIRHFPVHNRPDLAFLTTKTDRFNSRKRVQRFSPENRFVFSALAFGIAYKYAYTLLLVWLGRNFWPI